MIWHTTAPMWGEADWSSPEYIGTEERPDGTIIDWWWIPMHDPAVLPRAHPSHTRDRCIAVDKDSRKLLPGPVREWLDCRIAREALSA